MKKIFYKTFAFKSQWLPWIPTTLNNPQTYKRKISTLIFPLIVDTEFQTITPKKAEKQREQEIEEQRLNEILRPLFKEKLDELSEEIKSNLWDQAEEIVPKDRLSREMNVKCNYAELAREYFNHHGQNFCEKVIASLQFVKEIAWKK